jgi:hypothetical protein
MNLAVQLYSDAPSNPLGVPGVWPSSIVDLGEGTTLPDDTYQLMTQADYLTYIQTYQAVYDAWFTTYLQTIPVNIPVPNPVTVTSTVTTQFERTDLDLKMARIKTTVASNVGIASILVPGTFGVDDGRYIAGGYGMIDTYDPDDYLVVTIEDTDRAICAAMGLATDGTADATIQGMGVLPGALSGFGALPNYPVIKSYTDTDVPSENAGWYFYPLAQGSTLSPIGEIEVEPLGFYGHIPSGLYLVFTINRPNVATGTLRGDIFWGESTTGQ